MGLIARYPLNGTLNDIVGDRNLNISNPVYHTSIFGKGIESKYFDICFDELKNTKIFSVSFWAKTLKTNDKHFINIIEFLGIDNRNNKFFSIRFDSGVFGDSWNTSMHFHDNSEGKFTISGTSAASSMKGIFEEWNNFIMTSDGEKLKVYSNNNLVLSVDINENSFLNGHMRSSDLQNMHICDIRVYDHCLSLKEIHEINKACIAEYNFDDFHYYNDYQGITENIIDCDKIVGLKNVQSLLGKQNVETTNKSSYIRPQNDGSFKPTAGNDPNNKIISIVNGHKYFLYINAIPKDLNASRMFISSVITGHNDIIEKYNSYEYAKILVGKKTVSSPFWFGIPANDITDGILTTNELTTKKIILLDLTDMNLENLSIKNIYDKFQKYFDLLSSGAVFHEYVESEYKNKILQSLLGKQNIEKSINTTKGAMYIIPLKNGEFQFTGAAKIMPEYKLFNFKKKNKYIVFYKVLNINNYASTTNKTDFLLMKENQKYLTYNFNKNKNILWQIFTTDENIKGTIYLETKNGGIQNGIVYSMSVINITKLKLNNYTNNQIFSILEPYISAIENGNILSYGYRSLLEKQNIPSNPLLRNYSTMYADKNNSFDVFVDESHYKRINIKKNHKYLVLICGIFKNDIPDGFCFETHVDQVLYTTLRVPLEDKKIYGGIIQSNSDASVIVSNKYYHGPSKSYSVGDIIKSMIVLDLNDLNWENKSIYEIYNYLKYDLDNISNGESSIIKKYDLQFDFYGKKIIKQTIPNPQISIQKDSGSTNGNGTLRLGNNYWALGHWPTIHSFYSDNVIFTIQPNYLYALILKFTKVSSNFNINMLAGIFTEGEYIDNKFFNINEIYRKDNKWILIFRSIKKIDKIQFFNISTTDINHNDIEIENFSLINMSSNYIYNTIRNRNILLDSSEELAQCKYIDYNLCPVSLLGKYNTPKIFQSSKYVEIGPSGFDSHSSNNGWIYFKQNHKYFLMFHSPTIRKNIRTASQTIYNIFKNNNDGFYYYTEISKKPDGFYTLHLTDDDNQMTGQVGDGCILLDLTELGEDALSDDELFNKYKTIFRHISNGVESKLTNFDILVRSKNIFHTNKWNVLNTPNIDWVKWKFLDNYSLELETISNIQEGYYETIFLDLKLEKWMKNRMVFLSSDIIGNLSINKNAHIGLRFYDDIGMSRNNLICSSLPELTLDNPKSISSCFIPNNAVHMVLFATITSGYSENSGNKIQYKNISIKFDENNRIFYNYFEPIKYENISIGNGQHKKLKIEINKNGLIEFISHDSTNTLPQFAKNQTDWTNSYFEYINHTNLTGYEGIFQNNIKYFNRTEFNQLILEDKNILFSADSPFCGQSLSFNGANSYLKIRAPISGEEATLSAWVKPKSYVKNSHDSCIIIGGLYLLIGKTGKLEAYAYGKTPAGFLSGEKIIPLNQWSFITVVWDKSYVHGYINGIEDFKIPCTGTFSDNSDKHIGSEFGDNRHFDGKIAQIKMYSSALSQEDIKNEYESAMSISKNGDIYSNTFEETGKELHTLDLQKRGDYAGTIKKLDNSINTYKCNNQIWVTDYQYIKIKPNCKYICNFKINCHAGNSIYVGYERFDEKFSSLTNDSAFYFESYNKDLDNKQYTQDLTKLFNATLSNGEKTKYVRLRILNDWGTQNQSGNKEMIITPSLIEIPIDTKVGINKNRILKTGYLKEENNKKAKIYKNGKVVGNSFHER